MEHSSLQFDLPPWLIILCFLVAMIGSYVLYSKDTNWNKSVHYTLIVLRFICLFFIALLMIGPALNQVKNTVEKPTWVIAVDNSSSIMEVLDSSQIHSTLSKTQSLKDRLLDNNYLVDFRTFSSDKITTYESIKFDQTTTDINAVVKNIATRYEGRNIAGLVLISDGIYNRGISPLYSQHNFPIHTVGIGDSIQKNDLYIQELKYNKISYEGNVFPIAVTLGNKGYEGVVTLSLSHNNKTISTKRINLKTNQPIYQVLFQIEANSNGLQRYDLSITKQPVEHNTANNYKSAYVDIVEGKERILIVASAPHPDIKAIANSINTRNNYELVTYIPSLGHAIPQGKFDLVIYHGLPDRSQLYREYSSDELIKNTPYMIIPSITYDTRKLNNAIDYLSIKKLGNDNDKVSASINVDFPNFSLSENFKSLLPALPPLEVSYADIATSEGSSTLLYQRLGNVVTENPILQLSTENESRSAVFLGEGIWRWRLHEYNLNGNTDSFDELVLKLVQYLSTKIDRRKFKCYPVKSEVTTNEGVVFETEVYDDLYNLIFDQEVNLTLTNQRDEVFSYKFVNAKDNNHYKVSGLSNGIYQYKATTNVSGVSQSVSGELVISEQQIESLNTTADFLLLSQLARKNKGTFHTADNFPRIDQLESEPTRGVIHSSETFDSLINFEWLFILLITLMSVEWLLRKYNGSIKSS